MSEYITGVTRGGTPWVAQFVTALNEITCIGCGRCFKVCPRDVFQPVERDYALSEDKEDDDDDDDDDDWNDEEDEGDSTVMTLANSMDCIGCEACSKVCPKSCFTHSPMPVAT
jgi:Nif-specific ferredoxin III